jgi:hypothetical protein
LQRERARHRSGNGHPLAFWGGLNLQDEIQELPEGDGLRASTRPAKKPRANKETLPVPLLPNDGCAQKVKAISLKQPLPWLIFNYTGRDPLRLINLDGETKHRGTIWIHAGEVDLAIEEYIAKQFKIYTPQPNKFQPKLGLKTGGYCGIVSITDCRPGVKSRWASPSKWQATISDVFPMPFVVAPAGGVGIFTYSELVGEVV